MEIWSLYFFIDAVYFQSEENRQILSAFFGAFFGALAFGCRPTIALVNLVVIFLLIRFLKQKRVVTLHLILKLVFAALPYFVIGALLMYYNYVRFDNIFEFGQTYQLTDADQSQYASFFSRIDLYEVVYQYFHLATEGWNKHGFAGLLVEYPFLLSLCLLLVKPVHTELKEKGLLFVIYGIIASVIVIIFVQILESPYLLERYKSDYIWLLCIVVFLIYGALNSLTKENNVFSYLSKIVEILIAIGMVYSIVLFFTPYDSNFAQYYNIGSEKIIKYFKLFP